MNSLPTSLTEVSLSPWLLKVLPTTLQLPSRLRKEHQMLHALQGFAHRLFDVWLVVTRLQFGLDPKFRKGAMCNGAVHTTYAGICPRCEHEQIGDSLNSRLFDVCNPSSVASGRDIFVESGEVNTSFAPALDG